MHHPFPAPALPPVHVHISYPKAVQTAISEKHACLIQQHRWTSCYSGSTCTITRGHAAGSLLPQASWEGAYLLALSEELLGDGAVCEVVLTQRRVEHHNGLNCQQQLQQEGTLQEAPNYTAAHNYITRQQRSCNAYQALQRTLAGHTSNI